MADTSHYPHDAIIVLGGGLYRLKNGEFVPSNYSHNDGHGMQSSMIRNLTAAHCYIRRLARNVLICGGKTDRNVRLFGPDVPPEARIHAKKFLVNLAVQSQRPRYRELVRDLPEPQIVLDEASNTTEEHLETLSSLPGKYGWYRVAIITARFHVPRAKEFYRQPFTGKGMLPEMHFISAEDFLLENEPDTYDKLVSRAYRSELAAMRMASEQQGIEDMRNKRYRRNDGRQ